MKIFSCRQTSLTKLLVSENFPRPQTLSTNKIFHTNKLLPQKLLVSGNFPQLQTFTNPKSFARINFFSQNFPGVKVSDERKLLLRIKLVPRIKLLPQNFSWVNKTFCRQTSRHRKLSYEFRNKFESSKRFIAITIFGDAN